LKILPPDASPPLRLLMATNRLLDRPQPDWVVQAPDREMWVAAVIQADEAVYTLHEADEDALTKFDHRSAKSKRTLLKRPLPDWARYPAGVITLLGDSGVQVPGFVAVLAGDEPPGPRHAFGTGLAMAALCHELTQTPYTVAQLQTLVDRVRRLYLDG